MTTSNIQEYLESLPDDIIELDVSNKILSELPDISRFTKLQELYCHNNQITQLDNLPNSLQKLWCDSNQITRLDNLPNSLQELSCDNNQLTQLDNLPNSLQELCCDSNQITQLDNLPNSLQKLYCRYNPLPSYELEYWNQKTFERKLNEFRQKRATKIIKRNWLRFWYEPYRYEDIDGELIGISRYMEYGYNEYKNIIE